MRIVKAENYVINHHLGQVISQSFGATEPTFARGLFTVRGFRAGSRRSRKSVAAGVFEIEDGPDDEFIFGLDRILDGVEVLIRR